MQGPFFILIQILIFQVSFVWQIENYNYKASSLLFTLFQNVFSKEITIAFQDTDDYKNTLHGEDSIVPNFLIAEYKNERGLTDIWNSIRNTALKAWNSIKNLAKNTKEKIKTWIKNVKDRAVSITKSFEERLRIFKAKITSIIQSILSDEDIKQCFQVSYHIIYIYILVQK